MVKKWFREGLTRVQRDIKRKQEEPKGNTELALYKWLEWPYTGGATCHCTTFGIKNILLNVNHLNNGISDLFCLYCDYNYELAYVVSLIGLILE